MKGTAWYFQHSDEVGERAHKIKEKIKEVHKQLKAKGLTENDLDQIRKKAKRFLEIPPEKMTEEQFVLLVQIIMS